MEETKFNERSWLAWLVKVRVIIISFLLAVELLIIDFTPNRVPTTAFVTIVMVWFSVSVFLTFLQSLWREYKAQAITQIFVDLVFTTAVVYVTGGTGGLSFGSEGSPALQAYDLAAETWTQKASMPDGLCARTPFTRLRAVAIASPSASASSRAWVILSATTA